MRSRSHYWPRAVQWSRCGASVVCERVAVLVALASVLCIASFQIANAQGASAGDAPILRIETEHHGGVVLGAAVSPDGLRVATASYDKTLRIWSLPDLKLQRVIRMPAGSTIEGALYAIAFAPDGKKIATTGFTGGWGSEEGPWCLYVIDLATGDFERAVCDLPKRGNHLAYSPDGEFLAIALKGNAGLRVYRTSNYTLAAEDKEYGGTSTHLDFDRNGRLVTTSYDGKVRLYSPDFRLLASREMPEKRRPDSASFSPDGRTIAVGYDEPEADDPLWPPAIELLAADSLEPLSRPDLRGMDNGALTRVAWSSDGSGLYAAGTWRKGARAYLRRWAAGGTGKPTDISGNVTRVMRLASLPSGGLLHTAETPSIVTVSSADRIVAERHAPVADYTDMGDKFGVSRDGLTVQFAFDPAGSRVANFSFARRRLALGEVPNSVEMIWPRTEAPGLDIRDWARSYRPTLNGAPLKLERHDQSLAVAIASDNASFVLATKWQLKRYDANGNLAWSRDVPYGARGVVLSDKDRLVVAALGDGTIRWFSYDTGSELVALYPHVDAARWVAWTPSGYYMASVGGDSLVEWQVNRGRQRRADHFSVGRFKDHYYRPNIVLRSLAGVEEERAVKEANLQEGRGEAVPSLVQLLPPVIEFADVGDVMEIKATRIRVNYRVRAPSGAAIQELTVRNDGHLLGTFEPPALTNNEASGVLNLTVPRRDSELMLFAKNQFGVSEPAMLRLNWTGRGLDSELKLRRVFVLSVGVSEYRTGELKLPFASKDAGDFAAALVRQKGRAFSDVVVKTITNGTLRQIQAGLKWLGDNVTRDAIGVLFLAGHGLDSQRGIYHYLPADADLRRVGATSLPYKDLIAPLKRSKGNLVMFLDTCRAGELFGRPGHGSIDTIGLVSRLSEPSTGLIVYASSAGDQVSLESATWRNGAFTKAVVEGLDGGAMYAKREYITASMLQTFVKERVKDLTENRQTPTVNMPLSVPDLVLARVQQQ